MNKQSGFTLIELVMVIVIIGILSAVALPRFIDLKSESSTAAIAGVAGALNAASATNYAARKANAAKGVAVTNCTDLSSALQGGMPTGYTITAAAIAADATVTCALAGPNASSTTFQGLGIL